MILLDRCGGGELGQSVALGKSLRTVAAGQQHLASQHLAQNAPNTPHID